MVSSTYLFLPPCTAALVPWYCKGWHCHGTLKVFRMSNCHHGDLVSACFVIAKEFGKIREVVNTPSFPPFCSEFLFPSSVNWTHCRLDIFVCSYFLNFDKLDCCKENRYFPEQEVCIKCPCNQVVAFWTILLVQESMRRRSILWLLLNSILFEE